jgi:amino acid transporter
VAVVGMTASGISTTNVFAYAGTIGTYGYMIAYLLLAIGTPVYLYRAKLPLGLATVVGGLAAVGMGFVLYRNLYPVPPAPYNVLPWIFLGVLGLSAAWYAIVTARSGRDSDSDPGPSPSRIAVGTEAASDVAS